MLVDYVSQKKRSRALQRCHSTREISVDSVFLQKRCVNNADGPRRISADFGSPSTIFHQIMGHCSHALKNLDPRGLRTLPSDEPEMKALSWSN